MAEYNIPVETPTPQEDTSPNVPVTNLDVPLPDGLAQHRAAQADYGLQGKVDKTYNDYYTSFVQGQERYMRDSITNELQSKIAQQRAQAYIALSNTKQGPVLPEEVDQLVDYSNDPKSVIEDHFAQKYMREVNWPQNDPEALSWLNRLESPEAYTWGREVDLGAEYLAKNQFLKKSEQDAALNAENQGWFGWTVDQLKGLSGLYPIIEGKPPGTSWLSLPGSQRKDFMQRLWTMPYDQMKTEYNQFMAYYMAHNPSAAREFAHEMTSMSSNTEQLNNVLPIIMPGVEVSAIAGAAKAIAFRNAARTSITQQIQSAAAQAGMTPAQQAALASGNVGSSASQRVWGALINSIRRPDPIRQAQEGIVNLINVEKRKLFVNDGGDINGTNMLSEEYDRMIGRIPALLNNLTLPERFPGLTLPERNQEILVAAAQAVRERARDVSDRFWTVEEPYQEPVSRNWWANAIIGKTPLDPFGNSAEAGRFASKVGLSGHRYEQRGAGWVIVKPYLIPEDAPAMRPFYARLPHEQVPEGGLVNSILARFRTPNETQSEWANRNREAATFSSSVLENYAWEEAERIRKMQPLIPFTKGSEKWNDWERVVNDARKRYDDQGRIGATYRNLGELHFAYQRLLGRMPDEQEVAAYFAFVRINDFDHVLRTVSIIKHKQRLGTMSHQITYTNPRLPGDVRQSPEFDAIPWTQMPGRGHGLAIIGEDGSVKYRDAGFLGNHPASGPNTKPYNKAIFYSHEIENGNMKIVKVHAPENYPLAGYGGLTSKDFVEYVLAPSEMLSNKPLDWAVQLPKRGGGHFVYKHPHLVSQLDIREDTIGNQKRQVLVGKNTGWTFATRADAEHVAGLMTQIANLLNKRTAQNEALARDIVENQLGMMSPGADWATVRGWFKPPSPRLANGQFSKGSKPRFNTTEPFRVHMANENLANKVGEDELKARYPNFLDGRSRSPNMQFQTEFSQERDAQELFTFNNVGTSDNPMYRYEPAPLVDAIPTLNRSVNKISNTLAMDDMKINAVLSWIEQAKTLLNVPDAQLRASPLFWFHHGSFIKGSAIDAKRINELEVARQQIKSFIGQVSEQDAVMNYWTQKLMDATGGKLFGKEINPVWLAHTLQDPTRFFRAMAFHMKMGLFAIPQLLVQGQTYVNILGIAGVTRATQGTAGAMMHQWSRINQNPAILAAMGRHLEKFGYKPGEWEAMRQAGFSTGFLNVGSEYALRDNPMSNKIIQTRWGKFLEFGAIPFTEGERNVRLGAWYTAAKEYAEKKPVTQWTNADKLAVLDRASLLNGNMNRASNAMYQRGFAALPAQFLTYTIRQAELMWGKRLTNVEKARLLLSNVIAYGLPVGIGITGIPSDFFRNAAIEAGYNPGDNYLNTMLTEGIPSTILALVDHDRYWNVGERFGNTGLNDTFYGDDTLWKLAGGAALSTMKDVWESFDPFRQAIMSGVRQDGNNFNITYEHLLRPLRNITSFNSGERTIMAAKTGDWISKADSPLLKGITVPEAVMSFITGLQPQAVTDLRHMTNISQTEKDLQKKMEQHFQQEFRNALNAYDNGDPDNGKAFMTNAMMYLNVYAPVERKEEWLARAADGYQDVVSRVRQSFGTKDVPPELEDQRMKSWIRGLK